MLVDPSSPVHHPSPRINAAPRSILQIALALALFLAPGCFLQDESGGSADGAAALVDWTGTCQSEGDARSFVVESGGIAYAANELNADCGLGDPATVSGFAPDPAGGAGQNLVSVAYDFSQSVRFGSGSMVVTNEKRSISSGFGAGSMCLPVEPGDGYAASGSLLVAANPTAISNYSAYVQLTFYETSDCRGTAAYIERSGSTTARTSPGVWLDVSTDGVTADDAWKSVKLSAVVDAFSGAVVGEEHVAHFDDVVAVRFVPVVP